MSELAIKQGKGLSWPGREVRAGILALALVALADFLFWQSGPGLSAFLFYLAVAAAILLTGKPGLAPTRPASAGALLAVFGALPFVEAPSLWALLSATFGVGMLALASNALLPPHPVDIPGVLVRYGVVSPVCLAGDVLRLVTGTENGLGRLAVRSLVVWLVPLGLAVVFLTLFSAANPLIEAALHMLNPGALWDLLHPVRIILWGIVAAFVWPLLRPALLAWRTPAPMQRPHLPQAESLLFGPGAILRALVLCNGLFAVQTALDLTYLWGGLTLPEGMTFADYAHRGAYPLIVTALLAAAFVLAAMRPNGPASQSPVIRGLVHLFLGQNVLLVTSSIDRVRLYVEAYSLTGLRVAAGIWMGLVALGLVLILCRIALNKSNRWLIGMNLAGLGLTLYISAYVPFGELIARFNVEHSYELTGEGTKLDLGYIRDRIGPAAIPALDAYIAGLEQAGMEDEAVREARIARNELAVAFMARDYDWRSWTFRDARLEAYLVANGFFDEFPHADRTTVTMP